MNPNLLHLIQHGKQLQICESQWHSFAYKLKKKLKKTQANNFVLVSILEIV